MDIPDPRTRSEVVWSDKSQGHCRDYEDGKSEDLGIRGEGKGLSMGVSPLLGNSEGVLFSPSSPANCPLVPSCTQGACGWT